MDALRVVAGAVVAQSLFVRTGSDGCTWEFASLTDGGCALVRDGLVLAARDGSDDSVAIVLREFLTASGACPPVPPADAPRTDASPAPATADPAPAASRAA